MGSASTSVSESVAAFIRSGAFRSTESIFKISRRKPGEKRTFTREDILFTQFMQISKIKQIATVHTGIAMMKYDISKLAMTHWACVCICEAESPIDSTLQPIYFIFQLKPAGYIVAFLKEENIEKCGWETCAILAALCSDPNEQGKITW